MIRRPTLHAGYERLIGTAAIDHDLSVELLGDPRTTAISFGISPSDADLVADIHAVDLRQFSATLVSRLYGMGAANVLNRSAAAG